MPRRPRSKSESNIYHIILRSVNKQQIFYDQEDYLYFIKLLAYYKNKCEFELYAYCLMGNHIHLLIKVCGEPLETIFRRLGSAFVYWYNTKYQRAGHLFQDRYRSEPVENEAYFYTVLRYILQNPVRAGLCNSIIEYPYSSGQEYLLLKQGITDIPYALNQLDVSALKVYLNQKNDDQCLDQNESHKIRYTDSRAKQMILQEFGTYSPHPGNPKDRQPFYDSIRNLINSGISIRQMSRLTGISKKIIENSLK